MFRQRYERLNNNVYPSQDLVNKVENFSNTPNSKFRRILLKPVVVMMALIISYFSMPVLAANVPIIYDLMYQVSPSVAQYFMPVQRACESNGIQMEVVSAYIKDDTAQVYITLKDLKENRIDATTDLNDSYCINRTFECTIGHCEKIGFDEKTGKATFLITITNNENKNIAGEKLTFMLGNFMSHKKEWNNIALPLSTTRIDSQINTTKVLLSGHALTNDKYNYIFNENEQTVILPNKEIDFGVTDMKITGIGYFNNKLHIQVSAKNNWKTDNHGDVYLVKNETQEKKMSDYNMSFCIRKKGNEYDFSKPDYTHNENRVDFTEYVFDIPEEELKDYSIFGDFSANTLFTEGNWRITFPLEEQ